MIATCTRLGTDSSSANENDYVNSGCREKRKLIYLRDMKWVNGVLQGFGWNTVHCHRPKMISSEPPSKK